MRIAVVALIAACGRYGFEPEPPDSPDPCAIADGVCDIACVANDPDCITTCGDGRCVGNAGELCANCPADCNTTAPVCGNGACDPGEDLTCYADCGPVPWAWDDLEADLLARINQARAAGTRCPGSGMTITGPALVADGTLQHAIREWAWEIAHQNFPNGGCNGRSGSDRVNAVGGAAAWLFWGPNTVPADAVAYWLGNSGICPTVINPSATQIGLAAAHEDDDIGYCFGILLR